MHLATQPYTPCDSFPSFVARTLDALGRFEPSPHLAIAVSGGADSMALAFAAHAWAQARGGHVTAITIDHGLRSESAQEVMQVHRWMQAHGIACEMLRIDVPRSGNLQAGARDVRYAVLTAWCKAHHVLHLCTGHHADDQAETIHLHTARGDTADGASGMPLVSVRNGVRILRPLLGTRKAELIDYLNAIGHHWIEDPSNASDTYARNRLRGTLNVHALLHDGVAAGHTRRARDEALVQAAAQSARIYPEGYGVLDLITYRQHTDTRLLADMLRTLSGKATRPRQHETERLHARLLQHEAFKATLMGFQVHSDGKHALFTREIARMQPMHLTAQHGNAQYDARFNVGWQNIAAHHHIAPLGSAGIKQLARQPRHLPKSALKTLPALWHLEEVVMVPHIAHMHANTPQYANVTVTFSPPKPLAASPFWCLNAALTS